MNRTPDTSDTGWQSIRLGFGALLLVATGLGLLLLDSDHHAPSPVLIAHELPDQDK